MKTLQEQWIDYRTACYPKGIPPHQERECRQAFFTGALVVMSHAVEVCENLTEEQAYKAVSTLMQEAESVCRDQIVRLRSEAN